MKPVDFPQTNRTWAKDQPGFNPLPAYTNAEETITLWSLTWRERVTLLVTGRFWHRQMNFGAPLQALSMSAKTPFLEDTRVSR